MLHQGGVTTALDMGIGIFGNPQMEINLIRGTAETMQSPSRIILTPESHISSQIIAFLFFKFINADITEDDIAAKYIPQADIIIHLSGITDVPFVKKIPFFQKKYFLYKIKFLSFKTFLKNSPL